MKSAILAVAIIAVVGGSSYAISRYRIAEDTSAGKHIAESRAKERSQQDVATERQERLTLLLKTLEDSLQARPLDSMLVISAANISYDLGKFENAVRLYGRFLESIEPGNTAVRIDYAYALFQSGKMDEGVKELMKIISSEPRNQTALINLAVMYAQRQDFSEAIRWFTRCRDADPSSELGKRAAIAITQLKSTT